MDITSLAAPELRAIFDKADELQGLSIVKHAVQLATALIELWWKLRLLRSFSRAGQLTRSRWIIACTGASALVSKLGWLLHRSRVETVLATHPALQRMREIWSLSARADDADLNPDMKIMGLGPYLLHEHEVAAERKSGLIVSRVYSQSWFKLATELYRDAWPTLLRFAWAATLMKGHAFGNTLTQLRCTMLIARRLADTIGCAISNIDDIREECVKIRAFFQVIDTKGQLEPPIVAMPYRSCASCLGTGMRIQAIDASFAYGSGEGPKALQGLNFVIPPGALVCIVGGNGAGKVRSAWPEIV